MDLRTLLAIEGKSARRNLALFLVLLVILPATLTAGTVVFERTIPENIPVGVVAGEEATTDEDMEVTERTVSFFASPRSYDSRDAGERALEREEIYLLVVVPPDTLDPTANVTFTVVSDRTHGTLEEPINETIAAASVALDDQLPAAATIEHDPVGTKRSLGEYLVPSVYFVFVVLYGLVFVPYQLRRSRPVLDRLQLETRLETVAASTLLFYGALLLVSTLAVGFVAAGLDYGVAVLDPLALLGVALTYLLAGTVGLAVLFAFRLRSTGLFVDLGLSLGVVAFSGLLFPVGFFSARRAELIRLLPTHYGMITVRSGMLRDAPASLYLDYLGWLALVTVAAALALVGAIARYRRSR